MEQKLMLLKGGVKLEDTIKAESSQLTGAVWYLFDYVVNTLKLNEAQSQLIRAAFATLDAAVTDKTEDWNRMFLHVLEELHQKGVELEQLADLLHRLRRDGRTLLYRREFGEERILSTLREDHRGHGFGIELVDHDRFKYYNDTFGHVVGDLVLSTTGRLFRMHRGGDIGVRWGGDEYLRIVHSLVIETQLGVVAGRDAEIVESFQWEILDERFSEHPPRLSIGLVYCEKPSDAERGRMKEIDSTVVLSPEHWFDAGVFVPAGSTYDIARKLVALADENMYKAKRDQQGPEQKNVRIIKGELVGY